MKRILAILICLAMMAVVPACKPDNIQPPSEIITPGEDQQNEALGLPEEKPEESAPPTENDEKEEAPEAQEKEEPTEKDPTADTPAEEAEKAGEAETPADDGEQPNNEEGNTPTADDQGDAEKEDAAEPPANPNPLAAETFAPSKTTASILSESGIIKNATADTLKNQTISIFSADGTPAFSYTDEEGASISEWAWMKKIAEEAGFTLQYQIKPVAVSVKAQRTALYAGKKLSLIQLNASDLASGLTLCASSKKYLDFANPSYGVSTAVLSQSNHKLFAPIGMIESLWYNKDLVGETDPLSVEQAGNWTVDVFKALCVDAAEKQIQPLLMSSALPWVTISGVSPIGLVKDQKLDTNLSSQESKSVWSALQKMNKEIPTFVRDEDVTYSLADGNTMMEYTAYPALAKGINLSYAPLPKLGSKGTSSVTFTGTFFALPKHQGNVAANTAALLFAERWCNRYTEVRAAQLQSLGIKGAAYQAYADLAEQKGTLVLYNPTIEEMIKPFLKGITDESVNMKEEFTAIRDQLNGYLTAQNLFY